MAAVEVTPSVLYADLEGRPSALQVRLGLRREELLRLLLSGYRVKECAKLLRLTEQTVRAELANPAFRSRLYNFSTEVYNKVDEELAELKTDPATRLSELADKALDELENLLDSPDEKVKMNAVNSALDRNNSTSRNHRVDKTIRKLTLDFTKLAIADQTAKEVDEFRSRTS